jgi:hypothetical protein
MTSKTSFAAGLLTGITFLSVTAWAAGLRPWTRGEIDVANDLFHDRSGLHFDVTDGRDRDQALHVHAHPIAGRAQTIEVNLPGTREAPPDPCFTASLADDGVVLEVTDPSNFTIVDPAGAPLSLCSTTTTNLP